MTDEELHRGFDRGNFANAYETEDYSTVRGRLPSESSQAYVAAFTLGFFSSYEYHEIPADAQEAYLEAYQSAAGARCLELGFIDAQDFGEEIEG